MMFWLLDRYWHFCAIFRTLGLLFASIMLLALIVVSLGACTTPALPPVPQIHTRIVMACDWLPVLTFAAADTPATKQQIIAYELARRKNCEAKKAQ